MDSMYEILMGLPLFQGVSHNRISELIEKIKFHFLKYLNNDKILDSGDPCNNLKFLISGSVRLETKNLNKRLKVSQTISAPNVIGAEYLFGRTTNLPYSVSAAPDAGILQIEKADYLTILKSDIVFLFNMLNYLSAHSQKPTEAALSLTSGSGAERFAFWVTSLTYRNSKDIVIEGKQKDFYTMLGVQRSAFINTLEDLKNRGYLDFTTNTITIANQEVLRNLLTSEQQ